MTVRPNAVEILRQAFVDANLDRSMSYLSAVGETRPTFSFLGSDLAPGLTRPVDATKVVLFVDRCIWGCPRHYGNIDDEKLQKVLNNRRFENGHLIKLGIIVLRTFECRARFTDTVVKRIKFGLERNPRLKPYCAVLEPKGL